MQNLIVTTRVVDPDPNWIRIQQLCGSGSAFLIRIRINTGETGKRCNFFQCYYLILVTYFFLYNNFNILKHFLTFFKILKIFLGSGSTFKVFDLAPQHWFQPLAANRLKKIHGPQKEKCQIGTPSLLPKGAKIEHRVNKTRFLCRHESSEHTDNLLHL